MYFSIAFYMYLVFPKFFQESKNDFFIVTRFTIQCNRYLHPFSAHLLFCICKYMYMCMLKLNTRIVCILVAPQVRVSPSTQFHTSGSTVLLKCHAEGVPRPHIIWEMNESPLPEDPSSQHYIRRRKFNYI